MRGLTGRPTRTRSSRLPLRGACCVPLASNVIRQRMATKLNWKDLFLQDPQVDFARIFECWPQVRGKTLPIGLSAFGDAFFAKPDDSVWVLDTFTGEVRKVAASQTEFAEHMNSQPWQEQNLRSELVFELRERGMERGPLQVFAPVPHPAQVGAVHLERAQVLDAVVWHSISSQAVAQSSGAQRKPWWKVW
jgi:hypothetical protein